MGDKIFVDTNILLRTRLAQMDFHQEVERQVTRLLREGAELWINGQVIREFIVQATHPKTLLIPLTIEQVAEEIKIINTVFQIADETAEVRDKLLDLLLRYPTSGKQVHDANLVATMLVHQINVLFTLNTDDFKRFSSEISFTQFSA